LPEWLIERGIGETRAALIESGEIAEARVLLEGVVPAGSVIEAKLGKAGPPALAVSEGREYLLPKGASGVTEGARFAMEVTREAIPGPEPWKRPLGRVSDASASTIALEGRMLAFPSPDDPLGRAGWGDLIDEARTGIVRFAGGELRVSPTPAMTLIDVDGTLPPVELALAAAKAAVRAIRRHGIGGSIGIDFPTLVGKEHRQAVGETIDSLLAQPFERTAVNGFGFLQIVRPRRHASLFELAADRAAFEARSLLRSAARETGAIRIAAHPAVAAVLERNPGWLDRLSRQVGGPVTLRSEPSLPIHGGHAQKG
jgi:ribonuclease G